LKPGLLPRDPGAVDLLARLAALEIEVVRSDLEEEADFSAHRLECRISSESVPELALALIYAVGLMSFSEARPRGRSERDFREDDEWTLGDLVRGLVFDSGQLLFDADYVRGRMMKTRSRVRPDGAVLISTLHRHGSASRWIDAIQGRSHLRLVEDPGADDVRH
jgi:hypothetical protein